MNFLWGHIGWLVVNKRTHNIDTYRKYASDILKDPFYMKLEKSYSWVWIYIAHAALFFAVGFGLGWAIDGTLMAGVQFAPVSSSGVRWCAGGRLAHHLVCELAVASVRLQEPRHR